MARRLRLYQAIARGYDDPSIEQFAGFTPPNLPRRTRDRWSELFGFIEEYTNPGIAEPAAGFDFETITHRRVRIQPGFFGLLENTTDPVVVPDFSGFQFEAVLRRERLRVSVPFGAQEQPVSTDVVSWAFQLELPVTRSRYPRVASYPCSFLITDTAIYEVMPPFQEFASLGQTLTRRSRNRWMPPACEQDQEDTVWEPFDLRLWSCAPDSSFVVRARKTHRVEVLGQTNIGFPADDPLVGYIPPPLASIPGYIAPALRRWRDDQP